MNNNTVYVVSVDYRDGEGKNDYTIDSVWRDKDEAEKRKEGIVKYTAKVWMKELREPCE